MVTNLHWTVICPRHERVSYYECSLRVVSGSLWLTPTADEAATHFAFNTKLDTNCEIWGPQGVFIWLRMNSVTSSLPYTFMERMRTAFLGLYFIKDYKFYFKRHPQTYNFRHMTYVNTHRKRDMTIHRDVNRAVSSATHTFLQYINIEVNKARKNLKKNNFENTYQKYTFANFFTCISVTPQATYSQWWCV
jgi:hypothetical protein